jgi:hypothetical protein
MGQEHGPDIPEGAARMDQANPMDWTWALVEKEGKEERLYALEDDQGRRVPAFRKLEDAQAVTPQLAKQPGREYEIQAMRLEILWDAAQKAGAGLWFLDGQGRITGQMDR